MTETCKACNRDLPRLSFAYTDRSHTARKDICRNCNRRAQELRINGRRRRERIAHEFDTQNWKIHNLRMNVSYEWKPTPRDKIEQAQCRAACGMAW